MSSTLLNGCAQIELVVHDAGVAQQPVRGAVGPSLEKDG
jgi:hypothetical protein